LYVYIFYHDLPQELLGKNINL